MLTDCIKLRPEQKAVINDYNSPYTHATEMFPLKSAINQHCIDKTKIKLTN
jgi:hypothetical protein